MTPVQWSPGMSLAATEKLIIKNAFRFYGQNKTATSQSLGIAIRTLENKLQKYEKEDLLEEKRLHDGREKRAEALARSRGKTVTPPTNNEKTSAGLRLEPVVKNPSELKLPMPERQEVQEVLPSYASGSGSGSVG